MTSPNGPLRVGLGGPVGAGKTTLTAALARALRDRLSMAVVTNDIYTREDAEELMRQQILPLDRIKGVETGGCPHTAIREDASIFELTAPIVNQEFNGYHSLNHNDIHFTFNLYSAIVLFKYIVNYSHSHTCALAYGFSGKERIEHQRQPKKRVAYEVSLACLLNLRQLLLPLVFQHPVFEQESI